MDSNYIGNTKLGIDRIHRIHDFWNIVERLESIAMNENTSNPQITESTHVETTIAPRMLGMKFCSTCGASVFAEAEICIKCGVRLPNAKTVEKVEQSRIAYALFFIFLWPFGVHEFYVWKTGKGVAWILGTLVACIATIIGIGIIALAIMNLIAFIMGIVWLAKSDEEFAQYVNRV